MWLGVLRLRMAQLSPSLPDLDFSFLCVWRGVEKRIFHLMELLERRLM